MMREDLFIQGAGCVCEWRKANARHAPLPVDEGTSRYARRRAIHAISVRWCRAWNISLRFHVLCRFVNPPWKAFAK